MDHFLLPLMENAREAAGADNELELFGGMSAAVMAGFCAGESRDETDGAFDDCDKGRGDPIEDHQDGGNHDGDTIGARDGKVFGDDFADDDMAVSHHEKREVEAGPVREGGELGRDQRGEEAEDEFVERVLPSPAEAEAGEGDADLSDGEKFFGLREERQGDFGAGVSFFGEAAETGIADGQQRNFGASKKGVNREYEAQKKQAGNVGGVGHLSFSLRQSGVKVADFRVRLA